MVILIVFCILRTKSLEALLIKNHITFVIYKTIQYTRFQLIDFQAEEYHELLEIFEELKKTKLLLEAYAEEINKR